MNVWTILVRIKLLEARLVANRSKKFWNLLKEKAQSTSCFQICRLAVWATLLITTYLVSKSLIHLITT